MRRLLIVFAAVMAMSFAQPAQADNPGKIDAYVTPYYNSAGPLVKVGQYSAGLASKNQAEFIKTAQQMKKQWSGLDFTQMYVGAIRLYDLGYRKEATYWFYSAQYRGRQFALLLDRRKAGGMGDAGFELEQAQNAFFQVVGPRINGYAFSDIGSLVSIIRRVQNENRIVSNLNSVYRGVAFIDESQWDRKNAELETGLGDLAAHLADQRAEIALGRVKNGTQARFAHLTNRQFPRGV